MNPKVATSVAGLGGFLKKLRILEPHMFLRLLTFIYFDMAEQSFGESISSLKVYDLIWSCTITTRTKRSVFMLVTVFFHTSVSILGVL